MDVKKILISGFGLVSLCASAAVLDNGILKVFIDEKTLQLSVTDQRIGETYQQVAIENDVIRTAQKSESSVSIPIGEGTADICFSEKNGILNIAAKLDRRLTKKLSDTSSAVLSLFIDGNQLDINVFSETAGIVGQFGCSADTATLSDRDTVKGCRTVEVQIPLQSFLAYRKWLEGSADQLTAWMTVSLDGATVTWPEGYDQYDEWSRALFVPESYGKDRGVTAVQNVKKVSGDSGSVVFSVDLAAMNNAGRIYIPCTVEFSLGETASQVSMKVTSKSDREFYDILLPYAFNLESSNVWNVWSKDSGLILPARHDHPLYFDSGDYWQTSGLAYSYKGITGSCLGQLDRTKGNGVLTIFATPWLSGYRFAEFPMFGTFVDMPRTRWISNQGHFDKFYQVDWSFEAHDGVVGFAHRYREHLKEQGRLKTIREKAVENPNASKVVGAPVFWLYSETGPDGLQDMLNMMKADGLDRAIVNFDPFYWERLGRSDWGKGLQNAIRQAESQGYLASRYDQYRDSHPYKPERVIYQQWHTQFYDKAGATDYFGHSHKAFGPDGLVINPKDGLALAQKFIPNELKSYPYDARFFDTTGLVPAMNDTDHRPGHETSVYDVLENRIKLFETALNCGLVIGTEGSCDWTCPWICWGEGLLSIMPLARGNVPGWGYNRVNKNYPAQLNPQYRIPWAQMVYGDCMNLSWRWNDTLGSKPQYWWTRVLFTVLYGGNPMYFVDRDGYYTLRPFIADTHQKVSKWVQQVGEYPMVDFIVHDSDRLVQETVWQLDGCRKGVVVNFGGQSFRYADTVDVPAKGFVCWTRSANGLTVDQTVEYNPSYDYRVQDFDEITEDFEQGYAGKLRSWISQDRMQTAGVGSESGGVISGKYSLIAHNSRSDVPQEFARTQIYLVPFKAGQSYTVEFDCRIFDTDKPVDLTCSGRSFEQKKMKPVQQSWTPASGDARKKMRFTVPDCEDWYLAWTLNGAASVSIDDVTISKESGNE